MNKTRPLVCSVESASKRAKKISASENGRPSMSPLTTDRSAEVFGLFDDSMIADDVARAGFAIECTLGELGQDDQFAELIELAHQQAAALGHAFGDERVRHQRVAGKVLPQVVFAERDALHGGGVRTADEFGEAVEPEPTHEGVRLRIADCGLWIWVERPGLVAINPQSDIPQSEIELRRQLVLDEVAHVLHGELLAEVLHAGVGCESATGRRTACAL